MNEKYQSLLNLAGIKSELHEIVKLHGDASYRVYYRATLKDGKTFIVMQMPEGKSSASEEISNFKGDIGEIPFINVQKFLKDAGLPVPEIFAWDPSLKLMLLEDLGDTMMFKTVIDANDEIRMGWYKRAIELLCEFQKNTASHGNKSCIALQRSFDPTLLDWEFDHFREYLIEERLGKKIDAADKAKFEKVTRNITKKIEKIPYLLTHRDFQSKNLVVTGKDRLAIIDFQDALMGPFVYDLVALLRDSYVALTWAQVETLLEYYRKISAASKAMTTSGIDIESYPIIESFNMVTLQRKMKDAGRFVYIDRVKKNPNFLQYIPTTLEYLKQAFSIAGKTEPEVAELFEMLKKYVPEFSS